MIRVLLADDEPVIIRGLKKLIPWEQYGMEIVGEVYDGSELLDALNHIQVDIIVSDICMPGHSGIDIIKKINQNNIQVKVIFISAFQEFSYARDALAYGAIDYLVKPVNKQELENVLLKTISLIREENEEMLLKGKLEQWEKKHELELIEDVLNRLMEGEFQEKNEELNKLKLILTGPMFQIALVELDRMRVDGSSSWNEREKKLINFSIPNFIREMLTPKEKGFVFSKNGMFVILLQFDKEEESLIWCQNLQKQINQCLKLEVSIGIGPPVKKVGDIYDSYRRAKSALKSKYFVGLNQVIPYGSYSLKHVSEKELHAYQLEILRCMTTAKWEDVKMTLGHLINTIKGFSFGNKQLAVATCFSTVFILLQELKKCEINLEGWESNIHQLQFELEDYPTFEVLHIGLQEILLKLFQLIEENNGNKEKVLMAQVTNYIEEHYAEEITLEKVAAIVYMNPYYFSSFFKKHHRQNFKQYLTEVRMKHALRLLLQSDLRVYEIAEKVGYANPRHFSDMFKKMYGKLPNQYKQESKEA